MIELREAARGHEHHFVWLVEPFRVISHIGDARMGDEPRLNARQGAVDEGFHDATHRKMVKWRTKNDHISLIVQCHCIAHAVFVDALARRAYPASVTAEARFQIKFADVEQIHFRAGRFHPVNERFEHVIGAARLHARRAV